MSHFDVIFHRPICRCHESSFQWPPNAEKLLVKRCKSFRASVLIRREPLVWLMLVSILKHLIGTSVSLVAKEKARLAEVSPSGISVINRYMG